ncbi:Callose synthase 3 [Bienertia sinuspersici]
MGAAKLHAITGDMLQLFKARALNRLIAEFEKLLRQLRLAGPPDEGSDNQEDVESIASNNVNDD